MKNVRSILSLRGIPPRIVNVSVVLENPRGGDPIVFTWQRRTLMLPEELEAVAMEIKAKYLEMADD